MFVGDETFGKLAFVWSPMNIDYFISPSNPRPKQGSFDHCSRVSPPLQLCIDAALSEIAFPGSWLHLQKQRLGRPAATEISDFPSPNRCFY